MKNARTLLFIFVLIASILIASCGGGSSTAEQPQATPATSGGSGGGTTSGGSGSSSGGGTSAGGAVALDPANVSGDQAAASFGYVYEPLVTVQDGQVVGVLANGYSVSEDGLEYTFILRPGVTFHDGSVLNADLVVQNFNRWFDPADANRGSGAYAAWLANFNGFKGETTSEGKPKSQYDGIEKVNDYNVLIHLNTPDPDFYNKISNIAFAISGPAGFTGGDGGSGPYVVAGNDGATLKLEPFAGYWDAAALPTAGMDAPLK